MLNAENLDGVTFVGEEEDEEENKDGNGEGLEIGVVGGAGDIAMDGASLKRVNL